MTAPPLRKAAAAMLFGTALLLAGCGGGGGGDGAAPSPPPSVPTPPSPDDPVRVSGLTPFTAGCNGAGIGGTLYSNAEVEPYVAVNPLDAANLVGVWQQDRWSNGGARGLLTGVSFDGGRTWSTVSAAFSRCTGGKEDNGGDYERASDPWVTFAPDGTVYQIAIAFSGANFAAGVGERGSRQPLRRRRPQLERPGHADPRRQRLLQRQGSDHGRSHRRALCLCGVGPDLAERRRTDVVQPNHGRRQHVGGGAPDPRSGPRQSDHQQSDRRACPTARSSISSRASKRPPPETPARRWP